MDDEYVNFFGVQFRLNNMAFIENKKIRLSMYKHLQHLIEDRILYCYKIHRKPYHGYHEIDDNEMPLIDNFFENKKIYMEHKNEKNEMYEKMDKIKNCFIDLMNNKKKIFSDMYTCEKKINIFDNNLTFGKLNILFDNRLRFLFDKLGKVRFVTMILRYLGYGINGQHCSVPYNVYKYMYDVFGVRGEGFSSPLNSKLLTLNNTIFCTLFKDTDKYIGSKGPFSSKVLLKYNNVGWVVNPPYMENILYDAYKSVMKAFDQITNTNFLVVYFMPKWIDNKTYKKLSKSKYLIKKIEPNEGEHYMNCNGNTIYMKGVVISTFFLGHDKNIITDDKIKMLEKLWNTYEKDVDNQSGFYM